MAHTLTYPITIDEEFIVDGKLYYAEIDIEVDFDSEADAQRLEVLECRINRQDDDSLSMLPWKTQGVRLERIVVEGHPHLDAPIDDLIWGKIIRYAEDNGAEICQAVETDHDEEMSERNSED